MTLENRIIINEVTLDIDNDLLNELRQTYDVKYYFTESINKSLIDTIGVILVSISCNAAGNLTSDFIKLAIKSLFSNVKTLIRIKEHTKNMPKNNLLESKLNLENIKISILLRTEVPSNIDLNTINQSVENQLELYETAYRADITIEKDGYIVLINYKDENDERAVVPLKKRPLPMQN